MNFLQRSNSEKAQSMVEFAVSGIVILLLLVAIADFGRAFFTYLTMRDAAQEGALYASVCPMHVQGIEDRIRSASNRPVNLSTAENINSAINSEVKWECRYIYDVNRNGSIGSEDNFPECGTPYNPLDAYPYTPVAGHSVRVRVIYDSFTITTPLLGSIIGQNLSLQAEAEDTILRVGDPPPEACP
jgi:Flp pilus assembly protein TadG